MRRYTYCLLTAVVIGLAQVAASHAAPPLPEAPLPGSLTADTTTKPAEPAAAPTYDKVYYLSGGNSDPIREFALHVGAWAVGSSGSPTKVGEYQDLRSSAFWDFDGLFTNGDRTVDATATGSDQETTDAIIRFYAGPRLSGTVEYERFRHALDFNSYPGFAGVPNAVSVPANRTNDNYYTRDNLAVGQDFAIRVQEFKANFKGDITENLKWRLKVFGLEKDGVRQVNAMTHCYNATLTYPPYSNTTNTAPSRQCHVESQGQKISWRTIEVEPGLELNLGPLVIEYSHLYRSFQSGDQQLFNVYRYSANPNLSNALGYPNYNGANGNSTTFSTAGVGIVPDSTTNIDRIKIHGKLDDDTNIYAFGFVGDTFNELRLIDRHFGGADVRATRDFGGLSLTGFGKYYSEHTTKPTTALNVMYPGQAQLFQEAPTSAGNAAPPFVESAVGRDIDSFGFNGRWRPFHNEYGTLRSRFSLTGGYDYSELRRTHAEADLVATGTGPFVTNGTFFQPDSSKNTFFIGAEERWDRTLTTFLRYKYIDTRYPLYGVSPAAVGTVDYAINTMLPTHEDRVEVGGTWTPTDRLMVNATLYVETAFHDGPYAHFRQTSYPFMLSAWYGLTERWTVSAGYAQIDSWLNQDITLTSTATGAAPSSATAPWRYMAQANVLMFGSSYMATQKLKLSGEFEYIYGINAVTNVGNVSTSATYPFQNPPYPYRSLGQYSLVASDTYRLSAGIDYLWRPRITTYFRYNYYDFTDLSVASHQTGQTHMFLAGVSAIY